MKTIATELTAKQRLFCDEYLIDRNATRAALRAGYSTSTALGGHLMVIPKIKWYLERHTQANAKKLRVNQQMVLDELCKIAFGNIGNFFGADGCLKPMHQIDADDKAALWSVSVTDAGSGTTAEKPGSTKLRMYNKLSALDKIAKHLNFYKPELRLPDKEYIYFTDEYLSEYDRFDDDTLNEQEEEEEEIDDTTENTSAEAEPAVADVNELPGPVAEPQPDAPVVVEQPVMERTVPPADVPFKPYIPLERFRGAIPPPPPEAGRADALSASLNRELKLYGVNQRDYVNLSESEKIRMLWRVRKFDNC